MTYNKYAGYDYKEVNTDSKYVSMYLDGYENFGWKQDEKRNMTVSDSGRTTLHLKRERKIMNKPELTRLQHQYEDCLHQIDLLEKSKSSKATAYAIGIGVIGTAFMAGAVFAVTAVTPMIILCIILAIPGFAGWIAPYFVYKAMCEKRIPVVNPMLEDKYDEMDQVCEKGRHLLKD